jgi:putative intracellular protease/amidase
MKNVAILIFNDVEVLDFTGPYEVFTVTSELNNYELLNVFTVSEEGEMINSIGAGTKKEMTDNDVLQWI